MFILIKLVFSILHKFTDREKLRSHRALSLKSATKMLETFAVKRTVTIIKLFFILTHTSTNKQQSLI